MQNHRKDGLVGAMSMIIMSGLRSFGRANVNTGIVLHRASVIFIQYLPHCRLGDTLMVGGVYEPGATEARIYLPSIEKKSEVSHNPGRYDTTSLTLLDTRDLRHI